MCSLIKIKPFHNLWAQCDVMVSIKTSQFETDFISKLTRILIPEAWSSSAGETSHVGLWKRARTEIRCSLLKATW